MILLKERLWIGTHRDNGKEGGLNRRGGDRSTTRHLEKERAGVKLSSWPEIGSDGDVLLTPYVPKGITGYDDDDSSVLPDDGSHKIRNMSE
jgi:hypothetical protein